MKSKYWQNLDDELEIIVVKSLEEIEDIRPIWEEMQSNEPYPIINADIDRYISVIKAFNGEAEPYVMLFKHAGHPEMLIVSRIEKRRLRLRLGYKTLFSPTLRCLTVEHGGIIGQPTNEVCAVLIRELMNILSRGEADIVQFEHLRTDSPVYQLVRKMPSVLNRGYFPKIMPHWYMSIPENIDIFYQARSSKHRKHLKQYVRKLEKAFPGQVKMITYRREDEVDDAIRAASYISAGTYQYALGAGLVDNFRTRTLLSTAAKLSWLRAHILYINEEPAAFRFALKYGRTYFADGTGFNPKWKSFRIGTVLFLKVLEDLCRSHTVDYYDFYVGDAEYKRSYCNKQAKRASINIFASRCYPVFVNILRTAIMGMNLGLECVLKKMGSLAWIKRRWRNLLQNDSER